MIIIMKNDATKADIKAIEQRLSEFGFKTHPIFGETKTVIGAVGDKRKLSMNRLLMMQGVENIVPIMKPYKLAGKELKKKPSIISAGNAEIGASKLTIIAGPCAIESREQFFEIAKKVKQSGATILRGGAYKPRSSPYAFAGLEEEGLKIMRAAGDEVGLPICTEVLDTREVEVVASYADILQIGSRNMQNSRLLKEVGKLKKPVLLKRGLSSTIEEWLMAAEYIMAEGNEKVILCERGIRTFEPSTRSTFDISSIPVTKELSHLPIIADPSHAAGTAKYVGSISKAAVAAGADGVMIEVHSSPETAMSDGEQSLTPDAFCKLLNELKPVAEAVGRTL